MLHFHNIISDGHDGSVFQRIFAGATTYSRRAREAVVHRPWRVRSGVRQGQSAYRFVVQRHEEDQKSRVVRSLVQSPQLPGGLGNMQGKLSTIKLFYFRIRSLLTYSRHRSCVSAFEKKAARQDHRILDRDGPRVFQRRKLQFAYGHHRRAKHVTDKQAQKDGNKNYRYCIIGRAKTRTRSVKIVYNFWNFFRFYLFSGTRYNSPQSLPY